MILRLHSLAVTLILVVGSVERAHSVTLGEALEAPDLTWVTAPSNAFTRPWTTTNILAFTNGSCAVSGNRFQHNTDSWIETTVVGPGTISFYWRVSCETNQYNEFFDVWFPTDYLEFKINPATETNWDLVEQQAVICGIVGWENRTFTVPPGPHTLRWNYHKDPGENGPVDQARLDLVVYTAYAFPPVASDSTVTGPKVGELTGFFLVSDSDGSVTNVYPLNVPAGFSSEGTNWVYAPNGFAGTNVVEFYAVDDFGALSGTNTLTLITTNRPPVVAGQALTNLAETAIPILLEASDPDGDALSFSIGNDPVHGILSGDGSNWVYTSAANYYGADSFNFTATDGEALSEAATVDLMILPLDREVVISDISPAGESVSVTGLVQPNRQVVLEASESLFPPVWTGVDTQNIAWSTNLSVPYEVSVPRTNDSQFFRLKSLAP